MGADEAYDRLHGVDGYTQATPREEPCPVCGGSMRFCECMDDPFAPAGRKCQTCNCGVGGDGKCPCGCIEATERTREAFALGAAWALGDDEGTLADLREQVVMLTTQRDNAERRHERLESAVEALAADFLDNVDWSSGRSNYGDNQAWESAGRQLRALLPGLCGAHHWLDRPESDTRECLICGTEVAG